MHKDIFQFLSNLLGKSILSVPVSPMDIRSANIKWINDRRTMSTSESRKCVHIYLVVYPTVYHQMNEKIASLGILLRQSLEIIVTIIILLLIIIIPKETVVTTMKEPINNENSQKGIWKFSVLQVSFRKNEMLCQND